MFPLKHQDHKGGTQTRGRSLASRWGAAIDLTVGNLLRFLFVLHGKTLAISENMANQLKLYVTFSYSLLLTIIVVWSNPSPPFTVTAALIGHTTEPLRPSPNLTSLPTACVSCTPASFIQAMHVHTLFCPNQKSTQGK